jgi:flagellar FliJ protein
MGVTGFRLQPLLDHTEQREERKTRELAALAAEARLAQEALETLHQEREERLRALEATRGRGFDAMAYERAVQYLEHLAYSIDRQSALLDEVTARVLGSRDELLEILREKRSLERLREHREADEALEEGRREARTVDDMTSARYARRASAEGA